MNSGPRGRSGICGWRGASRMRRRHSAAETKVLTPSVAGKAVLNAGNDRCCMPLTGPAAGAAHAGPRYGFKPTLMKGPPFAG
ncbi:MAG TPA: hypothetical protein VEI45_13535 [Mycobacterium sp.]|uniref:PPE family protein, SVP subgroup n=1 Tax=Mycobacterium sp. TaxID=1785 RepID=UPI002D34974D|nr:hypothetical protein [Mycobacterium sp.]HXY65337.1 hypothetical protein [Mycobacterium sp.]